MTKSQPPVAKQPGPRSRLDAVLKELGTQLAESSPDLLTEESFKVSTGIEDAVVIILTADKAVVQRAGIKSSIADAKLVLTALKEMERAPTLPPTEAALFAQAGLREDRAAAAAARARSTADKVKLLTRDSMSVGDVAAALGITEGRVRQQLHPERKLFGVKVGGEWLIPKFQFGKKKKLLPGLEIVVPRIREDAPLLAVARFFTTPHADLFLPDDEEETPMTPVAWLAAGQSPETLAALAEEL